MKCELIERDEDEDEDETEKEDIIMKKETSDAFN